uniref:Lamin-B receptor n=2 Tax=Lygus hesperus TaxID=30085 RepID=A0A146LCF7_LYGHE
MNRPSRTVRDKSPGRPKKREKSRSSSRSRKGEKRETEVDPPYKAQPYRTKSPARKSPSRKSPARKVRENLSPSPNKIINKIKEKVADFRDSITPDKKVEEVIRSSVTRFEEVASDFVATVRRSNRLQSRENSIPVNDRLTSKSSSLQENNVHSSDDSKTEQRGSWFITLVLALAVPAAVVAAQLACTKESCAPIPPKVTLTWRRFFDLEAASWYLGYLVFQFILASLPLGFKNKSLGRMDSYTYRSNGLAALLATSAVFLGLQLYLNFPLTRILDKGLPIMSASIITAVVLSIGLYVKAIRTKAMRSEYGQTGSHVIDLFAGAETNARIGPLDIKTAVIRASLISAIIYNSLLIYREAQGKELDQISINVALAAALQIIYCLDFVVFESTLLSSFTVNHDGTGLWLILYSALFPFWITLIPKYLFLSKSAHNVWVASAAGLLFTIGYLIHRISNYQKAAFKRNSSSVSSADVIHSRSSSLFKGGLWGKVRHPNYLGALLVYTSWVLLALGSAPLHWIPFAILIAVVIEVLVQVSRVETRCQDRHASAWNVYSSQVKQRLIPKVF